MRTTAKRVVRKRPRTRLRGRRSTPRPAASVRQAAALRRARYEEGREAGYREGLEAGIGGFGHLFDGTSIVIPTYNQLAYLKQCIDSIFEHTDVPYEIIVIDNGSTDGTAEYLASMRGQIRYRLMDRNYGFAGAVNRGMMMAKGQTIVLLNNDAVVTEGWLENMLYCLSSDERIGLVGPVSNYISGEQQIETGYGTIEEMHAFAAEFNRSDAAKWQPVDRLAGFCLLLRRELWERTGYLDEGYLLGNYEDDDYMIRVRLQGSRLIIARDTFVHHFGSVSMKALGGEYAAVNERNASYYAAKWGSPGSLIEMTTASYRLGQPEGVPDGEPAAAAGEDSCYPQYVAVQGIGPVIYWIARGVRRPVEGPLGIPVTRLSQVMLQRWPIREPIAAAEVEALWHAVPDHPEAEGSVFGQTPDGSLVSIEHGVIRPIATPLAAEAWGFHAKPLIRLTDETMQGVRGLPIIAPARLMQQL